jgi:hypothetical protein
MQKYVLTITVPPQLLTDGQFTKSFKIMQEQFSKWLDSGERVSILVVPRGVELRVQKLDENSVQDLEEIKVTYEKGPIERDPKAPW